jgi:hypothetical protein
MTAWKSHSEVVKREAANPPQESPFKGVRLVNFTGVVITISNFNH